MVTFLSSLAQSQLFNFACVPLLLLQCSLLHPAYEADPSARVLRLLLLPIVVVLAVGTQSRKLFLPLEEYLYVNYGLVAVPTFHICCLAIQFAFNRGPVLKETPSEPTKGEAATQEVRTKPPAVLQSTGKCIEPQKIPNFARREVSRFGNQKQHSTKLKYDLHSSDSPTVAELIKFSIGIVASPRGLAYAWAPPARCLSRVPRKPIGEFLRDQVVEILKNHVMFLVMCVYLLPAANHPQRAAGWISETLGFGRSRALEIIVNQLTAAVFTFAAICAFNIVGAVCTVGELLFITLSRLILPDDLRPEPFDTSLFPALFNKLGSRDTLSGFWGEGWQCVFRRDFVFCGGLPMAKIGCWVFGPGSTLFFTLMGSMLLSGIFHEWGVLTITQPDFKFSTTKFFVMQGVGIVLERMLNLRKVLDGRRMRPLRYFVTYLWMSYWSQDMFEILYDRGLGRSGIIETDFRRWYWFQYFIPLGPFLPKGFINCINVA